MPEIYLSPGKRLYVEGNDIEKYPGLTASFSKGSGPGLLYLDAVNDAFTEEPAFAFWKDLARLYLSLFAATPNLDKYDFSKDPIHIDIPSEDCNRLLLIIPPMKGAEYVNQELLQILWHEIETALHEEIKTSGKSVEDFFLSRHSNVSLLGRICFHLAENKNSAETPFAFLATYAHQMTKEGSSRHLPLGKALETYAGVKNRNVLLRLLAPIHKASLESVYLKEIVDSGDIYHPLAWTPGETYRFLKDIPLFAKAGIFVKVPNWWKPKAPNRAQIEIRLGEKSPSVMGFDALIDFQMSVVIGDEELNEKEIQDLLKQNEHLIFFKGQWVEIDRNKLNDILSKWKIVAKSVKDGGVTFAEGMRWLSGIDGGGIDGDPHETQSYARVISGHWLKKMLESMRRPEATREIEHVLKLNLKADLRPYQSQGVTWLNILNQMRLGAILADDMGLGKTIQIISLLLLKQHETKKKGHPTLLIVQASLIGNWKLEINRFAPALKYWVAHPSGDGIAKPSDLHFDLLMTTYGSVARIEWLQKEHWNLVIADEAQAIKNPAAKQTRAIKALKSEHRLALTGTPVENHMSDLWSLFDFVSPGLLGSARDFDGFIKRKTKNGESPYANLRTLVQPYILRRLKTDKNVISDLPDKAELKTYCALTKGQIALYQKSVESLAKDIREVEGMKRRGVILSYLIRFKQICNHPSQFVKDGKFLDTDSGKFLRLKEICETISAKQEKVLIFTQFKEITEPLSDFLRSIFGKRGFVLHGETQIKKRSEMVDDFQKDDGPPYFVLSLKAGGTGLNLTAASHVIHFDRWWNPAVENQATDRAFRIGQKRNVLVHKFICQGTIEEKIDTLISSKSDLSDELLTQGGEAILTELSDKELLETLTLDIHRALGEAA